MDKEIKKEKENRSFTHPELKSMWLSSGKKDKNQSSIRKPEIAYPIVLDHTQSCHSWLAYNIIHLEKTLAIELNGCCFKSKILSMLHCVQHSETIKKFLSIIEQSCSLCWNLWTPLVHCHNEEAVWCFHAGCRNQSLTGERGIVGERDIHHSVRAASLLWWEADWGVGAPGSLESRAVGPVHKMASFAAVMCSQTVFSWTRETVGSWFLVGVLQRYREDSSFSFCGCVMIVHV